MKKLKSADGTNTGPGKVHVTRGVGRSPAMPHTHNKAGPILAPKPAYHPLQARGMQRKGLTKVMRKRGS
jgi:hypothetical protein